MQRSHPFLFVLLLTGLVLAGCDSGTGVPDDLGDNSQISFTSSEATVSEDEGSVTLDITAQDPGYKALSVEVALSDQSTLSTDEVVLPESQTVTLPQSITSGGTVPFTIDLIDDDEYLEGTETLVFELRNASGASLGETTTFTLSVEDNDIPATMDEARDEGADADVVVAGVVTRTDDDGFYLQDDSGALYVFDSDAGGAVSPGDRVLISGTTTYFSGLFQLTDVGTEGVRIIESGVSLPAAQPVTLGELSSNGEAYESQLVRVEEFVIDTGDATFQGGTNYSAVDLYGSLTLRIPSASALVGASIPSGGAFEGVLGQFNGFGDPDDNTGYQLLALETSDIAGSGVTALALVDFSDDTLAPMTAFSVASNEDWATSSFSGEPLSPYANISGFDADAPSDDWLISPALDLTSVDGEALTFANGMNFSDSGIDQPLTVLVSTDYDGASDPTGFTWTNITDRVEAFSDGNYEFVNAGVIDLTDADFQASDVYIAFRYQSSGTGGGATETWRVDNIKVIGTQP
jgi:hypothetical protein